MNKSQAVRILNNQREKLSDETFDYYSIWLTETLSYLSDMISPHDVLIKQFENTESSCRFFVRNKGDTSQIEAYRKRLSNILEGCIEKIKNVGVYRPLVENFLSRVSESWVIFWTGVIMSAMVGLFYIGYWYGQRSINSNPTAPFVTNQKTEKATNNTNDSTKTKKMK